MSRKPGKPKEMIRSIRTPADWYPNFPDDTVEVCVSDRTNLWDYGCCVHISVWGADDDGMELVLTFPTYRDKNKAYRKWVREVGSWKFITKKMLLSLGFVQA